MGVGPHGPDGLTPASIRAVVLAGAVFADDYTALFPKDTLEFLQRTRSAPILRLGRERLESGKEILEAAAARGGAVLLVPGDPMAATTHVALRIEAVRRAIPVRVLFAPSITHTAFSEAGLQHYKAGRVVTLPFPETGFAPTSPLEKLAENLKAGAHTLVLLDLKGEQGRFMTANEAIRLLLELGRKLESSAFSDGTLVVVVARAGEPDAVVHAGSAKRMLALDFGPPMHSLIVPGSLHFEEREALKVLCGAEEKELPADA